MVACLEQSVIQTSLEYTFKELAKDSTHYFLREVIHIEFTKCDSEDDSRNCIVNN